MQGGALLLVELVLNDIDAESQLGFNQWDKAYDEMKKDFELITEEEAVRIYFHSGFQMGRVSPYVRNSRVLQLR